MKISVIGNEQDYRSALKTLEEWVRKDDKRYDAAVEALGTLIRAYEDKHYPLPESNPIDAIRFRLEQLDWSQNELARHLHVTSGRLSEVMNMKRPLTLSMIRGLVAVLDLPPSVLIVPYATRGQVTRRAQTSR